MNLEHIKTKQNKTKKTRKQTKEKDCINIYWVYVFWSQPILIFGKSFNAEEFSDK